MNSTITRLEDGCVEEAHFTRDSSGGLTGGKTIIRYAPDGKECARTGYAPSGRQTFHETVSYKDVEDGLEVVGLTFRADGSLLHKSVSRFNAEGEISEIITRDASGNLIDHQVYTYSNDTVAYSHFDAEEQLLESWSRCINP